MGILLAVEDNVPLVMDSDKEVLVTDDWKQLVETGMAAHGEDRIAEAEVKFLSALEIAESFGEQDERLALSLNNLAAIYHTQGKYKMAEPLYIRSLEIKKAVHGDVHAEIALNLHNLAVLYSARKMYPVAEKYYKEALAMKEELFGADHGELLITLRYYAQLLKVLNRPVDKTLIEARMKAVLTRQGQVPTGNEACAGTES